jgi:hypothetical protein
MSALAMQSAMTALRHAVKAAASSLRGCAAIALEAFQLLTLSLPGRRLAAPAGLVATLGRFLARRCDAPHKFALLPRSPLLWMLARNWTAGCPSAVRAIDAAFDFSMSCCGCTKGRESASACSVNRAGREQIRQIVICITPKRELQGRAVRQIRQIVTCITRQA